MFLDEDILKIIFLMIHGEVYSCGDHMIRVTRGEPLQDPYGHIKWETSLWIVGKTLNVMIGTKPTAVQRHHTKRKHFFLYVFLYACMNE